LFVKWQSAEISGFFLMFFTKRKIFPDTLPRRIQTPVEKTKKRADWSD